MFSKLLHGAGVMKMYIDGQKFVYNLDIMENYYNIFEKFLNLCLCVNIASFYVFHSSSVSLIVGRLELEKGI